MANDIGNVSSVRGTSMNLNTEAGVGAQKPVATAGTANPGDSKPPRAPIGPVPMPK